jgi:hypothetical protein
MKRFFTDLPQGIILSEVLTPIYLKKQQLAGNFTTPQVPGATPGVFPNYYQ